VTIENVLPALQPTAGHAEPLVTEDRGEWRVAMRSPELRAAWSQLVAESKMERFADLDWLDAWDMTFGTLGRSHVLAVRHAGRVVGIAALFIVRQRLVGAGPKRLRVLRLFGCGEPEDDEVASEYLDLVAAPTLRRDVAYQIAEHLRGPLRHQWDVACFENLLEDSAVVRALVPALQEQAYRVCLVQCGVRYCVALPGSYVDYLSGLKPRFRTSLRSGRRRFAELRDAKVESFNSQAQWADCLDRLAPLHQTRWTGRGKAGVFASDSFKRFHRALLAQGTADAEFWFMSADGRDYAGLYLLRRGQTVHYYQSGLAAAELEGISAGAVLMGYAIERAIERRCESFDFMKGGRESYKSRYNCREAAMFDAVVYGRTLAGQAARALRAIGSRLRFFGKPRGSGSSPGEGAAD
jgi:CelD/BcsL family acetyltransferase involved in cellulose biosynthesis